MDEKGDASQWSISNHTSRVASRGGRVAYEYQEKHVAHGSQVHADMGGSWAPQQVHETLERVLGEEFTVLS